MAASFGDLLDGLFTLEVAIVDRLYYSREVIGHGDPGRMGDTWSILPTRGEGGWQCGEQCQSNK